MTWWQEFAAAVEVEGSVSRAADLVGVARSTVYFHRERSEEFRELVDLARARHEEAAADRRREAVARAARTRPG